MFGKTLKRACFGFVLGMAIGNLIAAVLGNSEIISPLLLNRAGSQQGAFLMQTLLSGVIGAAGFGGISLYEIERWPLLLAVLIHYAIYMAVFLPSALLLGWISTVKDALIMTIVLALAQLFIFLIMCAVYRAQVRELNQLQRKLKHDHIGGTI